MGPCRCRLGVVVVALIAAGCVACGGADENGASSSGREVSVEAAKPGDTFVVADGVGTPIMQAGCDISGTRAVWVAPTADGGTSVMLRDLAGGEPETIATGDVEGPAVDGDLLVWQVVQNGGLDIAGRDLATGRDLAICNARGAQYFPDVSNGIVVWEDHRPGSTGGDIWGWELADGEEWAVCDDSGYQSWPAIDGDFAVWACWGEFGAGSAATGPALDPGVYGQRLVSGEDIVVAQSSDGNYNDAVVDGNTVLWHDAGGTPALLGKDVATDADLTVVDDWLEIGDFAVSPPLAFSDGLVAWATNDPDTGKPGPLQVKDLATGDTWSAGGRAVTPAVSGDRVVWCEVSTDGSVIESVKGLWVDR